MGINLLQRLGSYLARAEIARLREALKTTRQALMEVQHAQECGPEWYTRGVNGMYQQTSTWVRKGLSAAREVLDESSERTNCEP